ncbi:MAG: NAD(P)-binding domain-containing protein, partial [Erythrobacter sp.]|nr:NAD(P)-binding domain-containing protein [Erythrobacter sp.]
MSDQRHIAFIGLGVMGGPMAGHLARAGYSLTAFNRSPERALKWGEAWFREGLTATFAATPADAARGA